MSAAEKRAGPPVCVCGHEHVGAECCMYCECDHFTEPLSQPSSPPTISLGVPIPATINGEPGRVAFFSKEAAEAYGFQLAEPSPPSAVPPPGHLAHIQRFLLEMYQTMVDPLDEFEGNIEQLCALLLKRAREDREALAAQRVAPEPPSADEHARAIAASNRILEVPYADPDSDECTVARQFLRQAERVAVKKP